MSASIKKLVGVVEGFYGAPWTHTERLDLLNQLKSLELNTYIYGPKDDDLHRNYWRQLYSNERAEALKVLLEETYSRGIEFIYAIAPGLDISYSSESDLTALKAKLSQLVSLGARNFAIFFDDIPDAMAHKDKERFGTFASAQAYITNQVFEWLQSTVGADLRLLFCPTEYCTMMAKPTLAKSPYLITLGKELHKEVIVMWTGPDIISREITVQHVRDVNSVLQRKVFIWDNFFANDYDISRVYFGPLLGRPQVLLDEISGIVQNPNCEYVANFAPIVTFGHWAQSKLYEPRVSLQEAAQLWMPHFNDTIVREGKKLDESDVMLLIDFFYTPYEHGEAAVSFQKHFAKLIASSVHAGELESDHNWQEFSSLCGNVLRLFEKLTYSRNRDLIYMLYSYAWELKEEVLLLKPLVEHISKHGRKVPFFDSFHKAKTFRGGFVADVRRMYNFDSETGAITVPEPQNPNGGVHSLSAADGSRWSLLPYQPEFESGLYEVCLKTGNNGADGTHLYSDLPEVLGDRYAIPYGLYEPDLAFVLYDNVDKKVVGYVLGASDSKAFYERMEREWLPKLREKYNTLPAVENRSSWKPSEGIVWDFYNPSFYFPESLKHFPAHLHIDIIDGSSGIGHGTKLMNMLLDAMRKKGVKGVHLGMSSVNHRAFKFYRKFGFVELARVTDDGSELAYGSPAEPEHLLVLGRTL